MVPVKCSRTDIFSRSGRMRAGVAGEHAGYRFESSPVPGSISGYVAFSSNVNQPGLLPSFGGLSSKSSASWLFNIVMAFMLSVDYMSGNSLVTGKQPVHDCQQPPDFGTCSMIVEQLLE